MHVIQLISTYRDYFGPDKIVHPLFCLCFSALFYIHLILFTAAWQP